MSIKSDVQKASPGEYVILFDLDATALGGGIHYFTQSCYEAAPVVFRNITYTPIDIEAEGFETTAKGTLPRPKLRISNVTKALLAAVVSWDDLRCAELTRWRTFRHYLPLGSPLDCFPPDVFRIERKTAQNKRYIEWELASLMDFTGRKLPRGQMLRDYCDHAYRRWTGAEFDYAKASCPYSGESCFDALGQATTPDLDRCGKRLSDCKLRFTGKTPLPTRAFPGLGRTSAAA